MAYFRKGDKLVVKPSKNAKSPLFVQSAQTVTSLDEGASGGWDVYDVRTASGEELAIYGFQVERVIRNRKKNPIVLGNPRDKGGVKIAKGHKATFHKDGSVSFWSVVNQQWQRRPTTSLWHPPYAERGSFSPAEWNRVGRGAGAALSGHAMRNPIVLSGCHPNPSPGQHSWSATKGGECKSCGLLRKTEKKGGSYRTYYGVKGAGPKGGTVWSTGAGTCGRRNPIVLGDTWAVTTNPRKRYSRRNPAKGPWKSLADIRSAASACGSPFFKNKPRRGSEMERETIKGPYQGRYIVVQKSVKLSDGWKKYGVVYSVGEDCKFRTVETFHGAGSWEKAVDWAKSA